MGGGAGGLPSGAAPGVGAGFTGGLASPPQPVAARTNPANNRVKVRRFIVSYGSGEWRNPPAGAGGRFDPNDA